MQDNLQPKLAELTDDELDDRAQHLAIQLHQCHVERDRRAAMAAAPSVRRAGFLLILGGVS